MTIRATTTRDWRLLKQVRLAALLDTPTAFGVSYQTAAGYDSEQWKLRASSTGTEFWLAFDQGQPIGMIGATVSGSKRFNVIGMWVEPAARGSGVAKKLLDTVKTRAVAKGFADVYLDVSAENIRAAHFYVKQGFIFLDEWEALESHPHITVQTMRWTTRP